MQVIWNPQSAALDAWIAVAVERPEMCQRQSANRKSVDKDIWQQDGVRKRRTQETECRFTGECLPADSELAVAGGTDSARLDAADSGTVEVY